MHYHATLKKNLGEAAVTAGALREEARALLIGAAADAHQAGMTQREIAAALGRSQPEVSRLLRLAGSRFVPRSVLGHKVVAHRHAVLDVLHSIGAKNVRVFGSVARGDDDHRSDVDLLVELPAEGVSLMKRAGTMIELEAILGAEVDVVAEQSLRPHVRKRVLEEAAPL